MSDNSTSTGSSGKWSQLLRFLTVGVLNTAIDFAVLFALVEAANVPLFLANIFSTGLGLVFSFVANRKFTFRSRGSRSRETVKFLAVTLCGLWLLQPLVIWVVEPLVVVVNVTVSSLMVAKVVATAASLTWNFAMYRWFVFRAT